MFAVYSVALRLSCWSVPLFGFVVVVCRLLVAFVVFADCPLVWVTFVAGWFVLWVVGWLLI